MQLEQSQFQQQQALQKAEILMKMHIADSAPKTSIAYKDTPNDIKRQLELEAGLHPSTQPDKNSNTPIKPLGASNGSNNKPVKKSNKNKALKEG
jgi:hypothetical protein